MPECNCTIPYYYEYSEYKIKSQKFSKLNDDDFAIKIVFDLLDKDYNIIKDNELVYSSVFEKIGIDTYNVITQITQHKSLPNRSVGAKQSSEFNCDVVVSPFGNINTTTTTQNFKQKVTPKDKSNAENNPMSVVSKNQFTSNLTKTESCRGSNCFELVADNTPNASETMTTKVLTPNARFPPSGKRIDIAITNKKYNFGIPFD